MFLSLVSCQIRVAEVNSMIELDLEAAVGILRDNKVTGLVVVDLRAGYENPDRGVLFFLGASSKQTGVTGLRMQVSTRGSVCAEGLKVLYLTWF